jgi:hypothetical protein
MGACVAGLEVRLDLHRRFLAFVIDGAAFAARFIASSLQRECHQRFPLRDTCGVHVCAIMKGIGCAGRARNARIAQAPSSSCSRRDENKTLA